MDKNSKLNQIYNSKWSKTSYKRFFKEVGVNQSNLAVSSDLGNFALKISSQNGKIILQQANLSNSTTILNPTNPYQTQEITENDTDTDTEKRTDYMQSMLADGLSEDMFAHPSFYQKCPLCSKSFNQSFKPNLLDCGHFLCAQCCATEDYCFIIGCKQQIKIRKTAFWRSKITKDDKNIYYLQVSTALQKTSIKVKDGKIKFQQVLKKNMVINRFLNQVQDMSYIQLAIGAKTIQYSNLLDKSMNEIAEQYDLKAAKKNSKISNKISIVDVSKGGCL